MMPEHLKTRLEALYLDLNKRKYVHPDPISFLYDFGKIKDREIVGLVASALAYGRVAQILTSVSRILETMGKHPYDYLKNATHASLKRDYKGFKHRFATGDHVAALLFHAKKILDRHGSMNTCFLSNMGKTDDTVIPALTHFSHQFRSEKIRTGHLVADPEKKSACKRMNLFLRWMVRRDAVDPGGWKGVSEALLLVPLDTHMHKIGTRLGFTGRKSADMRCALEITHGFKVIAPEDPARYDFALTRLGIRDDMDVDWLFSNRLLCTRLQPQRLKH